MKRIKLTQGQFALVDDEDYEYLNQWKWYADKHRNTYYAHRASAGKRVIMHRIILDVPDGFITDHIDHNGLNNQKSNLRICTNSENKKNVIPIGKTGYLGVSTHDNIHFRALIRVNKKSIHLGYFLNPIDAALAYDEAARKYHGEFANPNFKEDKTVVEMKGIV